MALTREWAMELLPYGIRVNTVVPAEVMMPLYKQWLNTFPDPDEKLRTITSRIPLEKRMTTAEEIAATTVFLISSAWYLRTVDSNSTRGINCKICEKMLQTRVKG